MFNVGDRVSPFGFETQVGTVIWISPDGEYMQVEWESGACQMVDSVSVRRVK